MDIIHSLIDFFMNLFYGKTAGLPPRSTGARADENRAGTGGLETRCVNPDYGCRFEVS